MPNQDSTQDPQNAPLGQSSDPTVNPVPPIDPSVTPPVQQSDTLSGMPVHTDLPPLPPDFQSVAPEDSTPPPTTSDQPVEDNGSAAPSDLPPMVATPKKKFGGGKIIATILGIFLLVGGIGAGLFLTQQQQDVREKAVNCPTAIQSCPAVCPAGCKQFTEDIGRCGCKPDDGVPVKHYKCNTTTGKCAENANGPYEDSFSCNNNCKVSPTAETNCTDGVDNDGNGLTDCKDDGCTASPACGVVVQEICNNNKDDDGDQLVDCKDIVNCDQAANCANITKEVCNDIKDNDGDGTIDCQDPDCNGTPECKDIMSCGGVQCSVEDCHCQGGDACTSLKCEPDIRTSCIAQGRAWCDNFKSGPGKTCCVQGYVCNTQGEGCIKPSNPPQPTPPTPGPTAVCQSVKAYSSTWQLLSSANLSALTAGTAINFCVTGSASTGSFDKGKFTINGVAQAETTTVRPSSTDFCQSYTIPAGITTFNVTAQIHHSSQGWK